MDQSKLFSIVYDKFLSVGESEWEDLLKKYGMRTSSLPSHEWLMTTIENPKRIKAISENIERYFEIKFLAGKSSPKQKKHSHGPTYLIMPKETAEKILFFGEVP